MSGAASPIVSDHKPIAFWRRINKGRVVALTVLASFAGLFLWVITTDFPPLDQPGTIPQRIWLIASDVICWPVCLVISVLPDAAAKMLVLPAFILSGLFWAIPVELVVARYARKA
jgi:hypothetical protein